MSTRLRFNRIAICSVSGNNDSYRVSRNAHRISIQENHVRNMEFFEEIQKVAYTRIFGKLVKLSQEDLIRCKRSGMIVIYL